jgi:hypothetical protein
MIQFLVGYWNRIRPATELLPGRQDFDPLDVPGLLPNIYLLEVYTPGPRFRFRVVGEAIVNSGAPGRRGRFVDEIPETGAKPSLHDTLLALYASRQPAYYKGPPTLVHESWVAQLEGVMLPMAANGVDVDHVLCLTVYHRKDGQEPQYRI